MRRLIAFCFVVCVLASSLLADEKFDTLKSIYAGEMDKIVAQHHYDMESVNRSYSIALDNELKKATSRGDLEAYQQLDAEKKRFEAEKTIPPNSQVQSLVDQVEFRKNAAIINLSRKYLAGLHNHKIVLMKAEDIEGALEVEKEVKKIESVAEGLIVKMPETPAAVTQAASAETVAFKVVPPDLKKGLLLWYDFNMDMDDKVMDQSGKKNHGTNTGAKKVSAGRATNNAAMEFSKSEEVIVSSEKVGIAEDADRTVAVWAKVKPNSAGFQRLLGWGEDGIGRAFYLCTYKGKWTVLVPGPSRSVSTGTAIDSSEWLHHVVVCQKGAVNWYINGTPIAQDAKINMNPQDSKLTIGGDNNEMLMDDVMIWNRALSEEEVQKLYKATGGK